MNRAIGVLTSLLFCSVSLAQTAPPAPVVNAATQQVKGTWAKQAVELIVKKGLVVGYPGQRFNWESAATRKEVAVIFARLLQMYPLDKLQKMLTRDELQVLQQGLQEAQQGVRELQAQMNQAMTSLEALQTQVAGLKASLGELDTLQGDTVADRLAALEDQNKQELELAQTANTELEARMQEQNKQQDELIVQTQKNVDDLMAQTQQNMDELAAQFNQGSARIDELTAQLAKASDDSKAQAELMARTQDELSALTGKLQKGTDDLLAQLSALQGSLKDTNTQLSALSSTSDARLNDLDARLKVQEADSAALKAEQDAEKQAENQRPKMYFGVGAHLVGSPSSGAVVRVMAGHDALLGNLGLRVTGDFTVNGTGPGNAASVMATYRLTRGQLDGYVGAGIGRNFTKGQLFGDLLVGADYRFSTHFAAFAEMRQTFGFSNEKDFNSLSFGLQYRF